ncbi:hypothetical protein CTZ27_03250 [Streptomyces griseocarneus]|nr:hypothetical protein CTZ27_03250 [Streptomyces griseocarneus]
MVTPQPVPATVPSYQPVIPMPHTSAMGPVYVVNCGECVRELEARGRARARGDEAAVRRIDEYLDAHRAECRMQGGAPAWVPGLGEFAVDLSHGDAVAGQVVGRDGQEAILRVPGEDEPRHTSTFRQASVLEELSVKNAVVNRRRGGLPW